LSFADRYCNIGNPAAWHPFNLTTNTMSTTETHRIRVYFNNLEGEQVSTVQRVTLDESCSIIEFVETAILRTYERGDFLDMEDCDCASVL
jgi:hypothetical protein